MNAPKVAAAPRSISASARALAVADERMAQAKRAFSAAVLATLREKPDAIARTRDALAAVDLARATLRRLADDGEEAAR